MGLKAIGREIGVPPKQLGERQRLARVPTFSLLRGVYARRATIEQATGRRIGGQVAGDMSDELRGYRAIAAYLGVPWLTAKAMIDRGLIPHTRRGRKADGSRAILTAHFIELERLAQRAPGAP